MTIGGRDPATLTCAAPFVAMEFDQFGEVQACCANTLYPLGNVRDTSLREIWRGERAAALRSALQRHDLSLGCTVCRYRLAYGYGELPRDYYDNFPLDLDPEWPHALAFALHNTCNLACVMCGADRSSKIRAQRSHLAPLPHAYGEEFFDEIRPFLEHAGAVDFSGGEPFLVAEHGRIWDMLIEMNRRPLCSLTTNGSVWNDRVEHVLGSLDTHICVSIDGVTPRTFESIRVGAKFHDVMTNLDRFEQYARQRGTMLTISFSLIRQNWFELGAMMRFAEARGIPVKVQTVIEPEFGVQRMPTDELTSVVESLEIEGATLEPLLEINRSMWRREVARLRGELEARRAPGLRLRYMEPADPSNAAHVAAVIADPAYRTTVRDAEEIRSIVSAARDELGAWNPGGGVGEIRLGPTGGLESVALEGVLPEYVGHESLQPGSLGPTAALPDLLRAIERSLDAALWIAEEFHEHARTVHTLWFGRAVRDKVGLTVRLISVPTEAGSTIVVAADARLLDDDVATPVSLSPSGSRV